MALELSTFVRTDEFIVKQPRVALTNAQSTLPAKTRPLAESPVWPLPNNIEEVGAYPYTPGDETPVGDEREGTKPPPDFAVEYMVYVSDEGSGINVSSEQTFETIDGWVAINQASGVALTSRDPQQGSKSIVFNKTGTAGTNAGIEKDLTVADYSAYDDLDFFVDVYLGTLVGLDDIRFTLEDTLGNKRMWSVDSGSLSVGWNTLTFDADAPNETDDVGFASTSVRYVRFKLKTLVSATVYAGIEFDDFKGTEILEGKILAGDVTVDWARNSNWQTKFEFTQSLNRWTLVDYELGKISNSPRLEVSTDYLNDFSNRPADFTIKVSGISLTVAAVADELAFGTPASGNVEFAIAEGTFNFNTDDLDTYTGKTVDYAEVEDGTSTVAYSAGTGVATLERSIDITFKENPVLSQKDLSLNFSLEDEVLASELSGVNNVRMSFVPTAGTISLRYDPVPDGYTDPLVENVDFTIDEDLPAILFTATIPGELVLTNFDSAPGAAGDADSSRRQYEMLQLANIDAVPNTIVLKDTTGTPVTLTEDTDYIVDLGVGQVLLTHGYTEETLLGNVFIEDTAFVDINFSFYVNGVEIDEYNIVPQAGWINIDRPLFEGDHPTVDYTTDEEGSEGTVITGADVKSPSVEVPGIGRVGILITGADPAAGGEFSFSVQRPPIQLNRVELEPDVLTIAVDGDRTAEYVAGVVLKLEDDHYHIVSSAYDGTALKTTLTLGAGTRTKYINPSTFRSKSTVTWMDAVGTHDDISEGVSTFTLLNEAVNEAAYYEGILLRVNDLDVYAIKGAVTDGTDLIVSLTKQLTQPVKAANVIEITTVPIPTVGDEDLKTFYTPIHEIPDRYNGNIDLLTLEDRFPGLGGRSIRVIRNAVDLDFGIDYTVALDGTITFRDPVDASDDTIVIRYVPFRLSALRDELTIAYSYYSVSPSGVGLRGSMDYVVPDTFYFRVVNNSTQAAIYQAVVESAVRQKAGQVSAGSSPAVAASGGNHQSGLETPVTKVGDLYDNDLIAQRIYDFMTTRVGYLESEKQELSGEVTGGYGGQLTNDDLEESARGTGRLFPITASIILRIFKKGQDIALPARPYRLPVLFGQSLEDDGGRLVMDDDYPTIPVVTFPPWPPQGKHYKGANQEPTAFGILGIFSIGFSASAPTTFIENWYPFSLDPTYVHPITADDYTNYAISPADVDIEAQAPVQDTGDPSDAVPIFPPAEKELDRADWAGFDVSSPPLTTYESAAPRSMSHVPSSYEGMAIGALQTIDDAIEADTLKGTPHRNIEADPTTYSDFLGWVYRDMNEYDLLKNGSAAELVLLEAEWQSGGRPADLTAITDNAKQQLLVLNLQKESLTRQQTFLTSLTGQITPVPSGDPEVTTYDDAVATLVLVGEAIVDVQAALDNLQTWYDDVIVTGSGTSSDAQIRTRWTFLTGVDVSAVSPPTVLPVTPVTLDSRISQVEARMVAIVARLGEINTALGYDNTDQPDFSADSTSEDLYTQRFTFLDLRVNRESGTLFKALAGHAQYVRDVQESSSLLSILSLLGG